jgi:hypothetical protein
MRHAFDGVGQAVPDSPGPRCAGRATLGAAGFDADGDKILRAAAAPKWRGR